MGQAAHYGLMDAEQYLGRREGDTEHVTLTLRPDQIRHLPQSGAARGPRIAALLREGLELDWVVCPCCEQEIRPHDRGPFVKQTVRIPVNLAKRIYDRSLTTRARKIAALCRELIDRALLAENRPKTP